MREFPAVIIPQIIFLASMSVHEESILGLATCTERPYRAKNENTVINQIIMRG